MLPQPTSLQSKCSLAENNSNRISFFTTTGAWNKNIQKEILLLGKNKGNLVYWYNLAYIQAKFDFVSHRGIGRNEKISILFNKITSDRAVTLI